jgi:hypothetical protein
MSGAVGLGSVGCKGDAETETRIFVSTGCARRRELG